VVTAFSIKQPIILTSSIVRVTLIGKLVRLL
jgi:hypothetical protein